jgi:hypothetical protein
MISHTHSHSNLLVDVQQAASLKCLPLPIAQSNNFSVSFMQTRSTSRLALHGYILISRSQSLLSDPTLIGGSSADIKSVVSQELGFLEKRTDFWRQQKPIYARGYEQKQKQKPVGTQKLNATAKGKAVPFVFVVSHRLTSTALSVRQSS